MPGKELSDEQLMQLISRGDRTAFEILYERYFDRLVWFARRFTEHTQQAEDVVQEVFMKIIDRPGMFDSGQKFSTWVYTLAANACKNILRNEQNRSRLLEERVSPQMPGSVTMQHNIDYKLLQRSIKEVFEDLNEKEKSIFVLRFEQELSIKEIAEILQIPEGSVKSGIYYLLKKLAPRLKEFTHGK